jgi:hypothetical protein
MADTDKNPHGSTGDDSSLADVVPIHRPAPATASPQYREAVANAHSGLESAFSRVFTAMVNVAFAGEWREKDDEYEEGAQICFEAADFADVKDPHVERMLQICIELDEAGAALAETLAALPPPPPPPPPPPAEEDSGLGELEEDHSYFDKLLAEAKAKEPKSPL